MKKYYVYILASHSADPALYIGMTNTLDRRTFEHKMKLTEGFTAQYKISKLVYFEETDDAEVAIAREKQLKRWHRQWKLNLIKTDNPTLRDLSRDWGNQHEILKQVQDDKNGLVAIGCNVQGDKGGLDTTANQNGILKRVQDDSTNIVSAGITQ